MDAALIDGLSPTSLVQIAREQRLVLEDRDGPHRVDLCRVDEIALALIDRAQERRQGITIVYPAPAGQVAVLLAAQLLLHQFVRGGQTPCVGIVTADPAMAARTWNALRIATSGGREPIFSVFPCYRAHPNGESPGGHRRLPGVIIGQQCKGWPVDHLVVDHLAGLVGIDVDQPAIEVFADPTDQGLRRAESAGRLIWGWSEADLAAWNAVEGRSEFAMPFSVVSERLVNLACGLSIRLRVAHHPQAEAAEARVREDLRVLRSMAPQHSDRNLERGLSVAWHHLTTLISLPCAPSRFDRFAGAPPIAARATRTFATELASWAETLTGEFSENATILASDVADLRAALEVTNPFERLLREIWERDPESLLVTRTATASRALLDLLDMTRGERRTGIPEVQSVGRLHRQGAWPHAVMIGEPAPWDWHRLLSGLAPNVEILVLGSQAANSSASAITSVYEARDHWGSEQVRDRTWHALVGTPPPASTRRDGTPRQPILAVDDIEYVPEPDPFAPLSSLFELDPLDIGGEGPDRELAKEDDAGAWVAKVPAVAINTDRGQLFLEVGRPIDVRQGQKIIEVRPELLKPGAILLVGRRQRRVGLIEALEERLAHRHDLFAARFMIDDYRRRVRARFGERGLSVAALHRKLVGLGCAKTAMAVRSWVTDNTVAPQHLDDLERLNNALDLGLSSVQVRELFAGVQRRRGFRRAAGRALAAAARGATVVADESHIDSETGLSIADLREAVVEAIVVDVTPCDQLTPLTLLGTLEDS